MGAASGVCPTRQEYEALVAAVRLAAALTWSRGKVTAKEDDLGERFPQGIVEETRRNRSVFW